MTVNETSFQSLALAVLGPDASSPDALEAVTLETLLWKAGEHRRHIEDAHDWLDLHGVPRSFESEKGIKQVYTLRGRLEQMR